MPQEKELLEAAIIGDLDKVKLAIKAGADINTKREDGWSPLHLAAHKGHLNIVKFLLKNGANLEAQGAWGWTSLHFAAHEVQLATVNFLIKHGANANVHETLKRSDVNNRGYTPAELARARGSIVQTGKHVLIPQQNPSLIAKNHYETAAFIEQTGKDIQAFWAALSAQNIDALAFLLAKGVHLNTRQAGTFNTALIIASHFGYTKVVKFLLGWKGKKTIKKTNVAGLNALHCAVSQGHIETVKLLVEFDPSLINVKVLDAIGHTPLHLAAHANRDDIINYLLSKGAAINEQRTYDKMTPLHVAAYFAYDMAAKCLINNEANIEASDNNGLRPLHWAVKPDGKNGDKPRQKKTIDLLLQSGANRQATDNDNKQPLDYADNDLQTIFSTFDQQITQLNSQLLAAVNTTNLPEDSILASVKALVEKGAVINTQNSSGRTPLSLAVSNNYLKVIKYFLDCGANLEFPDNGGSTPLIWAAWSSSQETVQLLLNRGANVFAKEKKGNDSEYWAALRTDNNATIKKLLADAKVGHDSLLKKAATGQIRTKKDIRKLYQQGALMWATDNNQNNALHLAAKNGHCTTVKVLLNFHLSNRPGKEAFWLNHAFQRSLVNAQDANGDTPLALVVSEACKRENDHYLHIIKRLLASGADINSVNPKKNNQTPLSIAKAVKKPSKLLLSIRKLFEDEIAFEDNKEKLFKTINKLSWDTDSANDKNTREKLTTSTNATGNTYFQWIILEKNIAFFDRFLEFLSRLPNPNFGGLNRQIEQKDAEGNNTFHIIALSGFIHKIDTLLSQGMNFRGEDRTKKVLATINKRGKTPLMLAIRSHHNEIALKLLKVSPVKLLYQNAEAGDVQKLEERTRKKIDKKHTVLHYAVIHNNLAFIDKLFLQTDGAKYISTGLMETDIHGKTPFHYAAQYGHLDILSYFIAKAKQKKIDVSVEALLNQTDSEGKTPLHLAVENNKLDTVKYLIALGANLTLQDNKKNTPLKIAENQKPKNEKLLQLLKDCTRLSIQTELVLPPQELTDFVFQGGGVKGFAYKGALEAILNSTEFNFLVKKIDSLCGASAGAITTLMLGLGFGLKKDQDGIKLNPQELDDLLSSVTADLLLSNVGDSDTSDDPTINFGKKFLNFKKSNPAFAFDEILIPLMSLLAKYAIENKLDNAEAFTNFYVKYILKIPGITFTIQQILKIANYWLGGSGLEEKLKNCFGLNKSEDFKPFLEAMIDKLVNKFGLFDGFKFLEWLKAKIAEKTKCDEYPNGFPDITFKEFARLADAHPELQLNKNIYFVGVNLTTQRTEIFSLEHTPDAVIADAVRISMSIPGFFVPHKLMQKKDVKDQPYADDYLYVDGGVNDNFPLWVLDLNEQGEMEKLNQNVLGLRLVSSDLKYQYENQDIFIKPKPVSNLWEYVLNMANCFMDKQESDHRFRKEDRRRTAYIDYLDISAIDFDLSPEQKKALEDSGRLALYGYLARKHIQYLDSYLKKQAMQQTANTLLGNITFFGASVGSNSAAQSTVPVNSNNSFTCTVS